MMMDVKMMKHHWVQKRGQGLIEWWLLCDGNDDDHHDIIITITMSSQSHHYHNHHHHSHIFIIFILIIHSVFCSFPGLTAVLASSIIIFIITLFLGNNHNDHTITSWSSSLSSPSSSLSPSSSIWECLKWSTHF